MAGSYHKITRKLQQQYQELTSPSSSYRTFGQPVATKTYAVKAKPTARVTKCSGCPSPNHF